MSQIAAIIGMNVRKYRKLRGLTQEVLALEAKINSDYLSRLELGKENPTVNTLCEIANVLKVDVIMLLKEEE